MSDGFSIKVTSQDMITPRLKRAALEAKSPRLMKEVGTGLVGLTKRSFNDQRLRPAPWQAKQDGSAATLKSREATLWRRVRVVAATARSVRIGSDRPYAAIHQLGGKTRPMPARPFFPFTPAGQLTPLGEKNVAQVITTVLKL